MHYTERRLSFPLKTLDRCRVLQQQEVTGWRYLPCEYKVGNEIPDWRNEPFMDYDGNGRWSKEGDKHAWICTHIVVPESWRGQHVRFHLNNNGDGILGREIVAYIDGKPVQGMDKFHVDLEVSQYTEFDLALYAHSGRLGIATDFSAHLQLIHDQCEALYYDFKVPYDILMITSEGEKSHGDLVRILYKVVDALDLRAPGSAEFYNSVDVARKCIQEELYDKYAGDGPDTLVCVGQTHIDLAWLWTLAQTREKVQRSFATVVELMRRYPQYRFMASQPQIYQYLKEESPETYEQVKALVKEGRWEAEGGMWVEADCNLTSGESLVRQFLHGKRFYQQEFGVDSHIMWAPDTFGFTGALPQIMQKSGVDTYITNKLNWSQWNPFPHQLFTWQGIDGTDVKAVQLTQQKKVRDGKPQLYTSLDSHLTPSNVRGSWERFYQKELTDEVLHVYGYGDGGGGPTAEMLELGTRMQKSIGFCPKITFETFDSYIKRNLSIWKNPHTPIYRGELYLEAHRGCLTSIAKIKRLNRKCEFAMHNAELWASVEQKLLAGNYPQEQLDKQWKVLLAHQFHDILPGSSIQAVNDLAVEVLTDIQNEVSGVAQSKLETIAKNVKTQGGLLVFNPNGFQNSGYVTVDGKKVFVENIPANGWAVVTPKEPENSVTVGDRMLENKFLKLTFDENYNLISVFDKNAKREIVDGKKGACNRLEVFEDYSHDEFDAWEIKGYYREKVYYIDDVQSVETVNEGGRAGYKIVRKFMDSLITQTIWMYEDTQNVDFETEVDWKQEHLLLKAAFPVQINSDRATYDIQFGALERPTHFNDCYDQARFEACGQKFCDFGEHDYGVAILNDCKYGHAIHEGIMRLTLIKSATFPDKVGDRCHHIFTYSLMPHTGDYRDAGVLQRAYDLNNPLTAVAVGKQEGLLPEQYALVQVSRKNVILETVKKAEDSQAQIFRMYDSANQRCEAVVTFGFTPKRVCLCDLMEKELEELTVCDNSVTVPVKPYEIISLKVE